MSGSHNMNLYGDGTVFRGERSADSEVPTVDINELRQSLGAIQTEKVAELLDRLEEAESDALEQARLNGIGAEKELALMAKLEAAEKERDALRDAIAKDSDTAYMLLRWAETEMRYAGWGDRANDNNRRTDVYEAVVEFLK